MSPRIFNDHQNSNNNKSPEALKMNKESQMIKKPSLSSMSSCSPSSSSSSVSSFHASNPSKTQQRRPVIIYTHSPKIIHTSPKDFMALVQKLTGMPEEDRIKSRMGKEKHGGGGGILRDEANENVKMSNNDDDESSCSVITTEIGNNFYGKITGDHPQINSCFDPPVFDTSNPFMSNLPIFTTNSADFLCANQPFFNFTADSLLFPPAPNSIRNTLEGIKEFHEY